MSPTFPTKSQTAINFHPFFHNTYRMTLVESAAFGVSSFISHGGNAGAVSMLGSGEGCIDINLKRILESHDDNKGSDCNDGSIMDITTGELIRHNVTN